MAIAAIKKKASACTTSQELLQLVQEYRDRFSDKNGRPLPIVKELSDYVSKRNDEIESGAKKETAEKPAEKEENKTVTPEDKKLSNGKTIKEMREKYGIKVDDKSKKDIKNMSDEELDSEIKRLDEEKEELSKKATELYDKNSGWWRGLEKEDELPGSDYQKWNKLRAEVQDRMHDAAELAIERGKRKAAKNKDSKSTFVNGYGESTTREITSQTYKRQQKRLENDVLRNMGVKKSITLLVSKSLTNFILEEALGM